MLCQNETCEDVTLDFGKRWSAFFITCSRLVSVYDRLGISFEFVWLQKVSEKEWNPDESLDLFYHFRAVSSRLSLPWTLSHTLKCVCVCVSVPQWDSHDRGWRVRETGQSEMCRSLLPVPSGEHSPAVQPRMSEELHKSSSWYFKSSVFTQAARHRHQVKFNAVDVFFFFFFNGTENGDTILQMEKMWHWEQLWVCVWPGGPPWRHFTVFHNS